MNIRKGFFRLTLVLSILCGILAIYFSEDITSGIRSSRNIGIRIPLPSDWRNKTLEEKLNSIDQLLILEKKNEKKKESPTLEEALREWSLADYSTLTSKEQQNVKRRLREQIIPDEKKSPKGEERRNFDMSSGPDWKEKSFLLFINFIIGFAPVWLIYALTRWVIFGFVTK